MFREFYESAWHHPGLLCLFPLLSLPFLPRRRSFLAVYLWLFSLETLLDAWLTSPLAGLSGAAGKWTGITFVILGDLRLFVLLERFARPDAASAWLGRALGASLVVPILQAACQILWPEAFADSRHVFLGYEVLFLVWLIVYRRFALARRVPDEALDRWLNGLLHFALAYYALWALADVGILSGADPAHGLRILPNLLYYGLFLPFALATAPQELR